MIDLIQLKFGRHHIITKSKFMSHAGRDSVEKGRAFGHLFIDI